MALIYSNRSNSKLTKRYLIWCYKTTKESLDRIDRYYTQLEVDQFVLDCLNKSCRDKVLNQDKEYKENILKFENYMTEKKTAVDEKKYKNESKNMLNSEYLYLQQRMSAIEKAIIRFLGKSELKKICGLYEEEMTRRILEAREHS